MNKCKSVKCRPCHGSLCPKATTETALILTRVRYPGSGIFGGKITPHRTKITLDHCPPIFRTNIRHTVIGKY